MKHTPLYEEHVQAGAKLVEFAGWEMPLHYGSQLKEHQQVRSDAGMFDVSHMTVVEIVGEAARAFLQYLLANDVAKLSADRMALYSCMLNEKAGVVDDLLVYRLSSTHYRLVVNAATCEKDIAWIQQHAKGFAEVAVQTPQDKAMIAIQGPNAIDKAVPVLVQYGFSQDQLIDLKRFHVLRKEQVMVARTGYTGEDGFEVIVNAEFSTPLWKDLMAVGIMPAGLGSRDTLRLEAGFNLYGSDMDESTHPLESNLEWTVSLKGERPFVGREAYETIKRAGSAYKLLGIVLLVKGVLRNHQKLFCNGQEVGMITSGGYSPSLGCGIALARINQPEGSRLEIEQRGKRLPAVAVKPPFCQNGQVIELERYHE